MAQYPFNIDVSTVGGQLEVLRLWSNAELTISTALLILKVTTAELLQLAQTRHRATERGSAAQAHQGSGGASATPAP